MSVISCPRCDEAVRVPESLATAGSTAPNGSVRCPWCRETLSVSDVVGALPPMFEIIALDDSVTDTPMLGVDDEFASFEPTGNQTGFDEYQLADPIQNAGPSIAPVARPVGASRSRAGAKKGSGIGAVIKMALGGLLAIPIAATILSLIGKPLPIDFGFFPFQGDGSSGRSGRVISSPPRPRAEAPASSGSTSRRPPASRVITPATSDTATSGTARNVPALSEFAIDQTVTPASSADEPSAAELAFSEIQDSAGMPNAGLEMPDRPTDSIASNQKPPKPSLVVEPAPKNEALANADPPEPVPMDSEAASGESSAALSPELTETLAEASSAVAKAIDLHEVGSRYKLAFQDAYRKVANVAAMLDDESASDESVKALMQGIVASSKMREMFSDVGPRWPQIRGRKTDGILLIGESKEMNGEKRIDFGDDQTLSVQFDSELPKGRIIALGRIVDNGRNRNDAEGPLVELFAVELVK